MMGLEYGKGPQSTEAEEIRRQILSGELDLGSDFLEVMDNAITEGDRATTVNYVQVVESDFERELRALINRHSMENGSNTPDFQLTKYLIGCLELFDQTVNFREAWYGRHKTVPKV